MRLPVSNLARRGPASGSVEATLTRADAAASTWDVLVVGAGPAGAVLAHRVAAAGLRTLMVDRSAFPRDKVCGGCLSAGTLELLDDAALGPAVRALGAVPFDRVQVAAGTRRAELCLPPGLSVSRYRLDAALARAAIAVGAHFLPRQRAALGAATAAGREVTLHDGERTASVRAAAVVDASGLASALVGVAARRAWPRSARVGGAAILAAATPHYGPGAIHMAVGRHGYVGLVRLEDGRLNVAAAMDRAAVRRHGPGALAAAVLASADLPPIEGLASASWSGTPRLSHRPRRRAAERLFALGDAAGYAEPFTGEGIGWAVRAADSLAPLLARAVNDWTPRLARRWSASHAREKARAERSCRTIARLLRRPLLVGIGLWLLERHPELSAPLVRRVQAGSARQGEAWL